MLFYAIAFAVAATDAKLEVVVALGQWLSHPQHPSFATRETWLTDRVLPWMPNVDSVIVLDMYEQNRNHPLLAQSAYAPESEAWMNSHSVESAFNPELV